MVSKRDREIVRRIMNDYYKDINIFEYKKNLLEFQILEDATEEEQMNFYFFLIFNDKQVKSIVLYNAFKRMFYSNKNLFDAKKVIYFTDELRNALENTPIIYKNKSAEFWIENAKKILNEYGSVKNLFFHSNDAVILKKHIKEFKGYGEKTSGLLIRVINSLYNKLENLDEINMPVDTHDSKIAMRCGLIENFKYENANKTKLLEVSKKWMEIAKIENLRWEDLDKALWILGSVGCVKKMCEICPIRDFCKEKNESIFDYKAL